jgi:predicted ATPase
MGNELLERELSLNVLASLLNEARAGTGRTALVSGEAGVGKTALIESFGHTQSVRSLWGSCEALLTPSPLGPLHDIAYQLRGRLIGLIESGASRQSLFSTRLLERGPRLVGQRCVRHLLHQRLGSVTGDHSSRAHRRWGKTV